MRRTTTFLKPIHVAIVVAANGTNFQELFSILSHLTAQPHQATYDIFTPLSHPTDLLSSSSFRGSTANTHEDNSNHQQHQRREKIGRLCGGAPVFDLAEWERYMECHDALVLPGGDRGVLCNLSNFGLVRPFSLATEHTIANNSDDTEMDVVNDSSDEKKKTVPSFLTMRAELAAMIQFFNGKKRPIAACSLAPLLVGCALGKNYTAQPTCSISGPPKLGVNITVGGIHSGMQTLMMRTPLEGNNNNNNNSNRHETGNTSGSSCSSFTGLSNPQLLSDDEVNEAISSLIQDNFGSTFHKSQAGATDQQVLVDFRNRVISGRGLSDFYPPSFSFPSSWSSLKEKEENSNVDISEEKTQSATSTSLRVRGKVSAGEAHVGIGKMLEKVMEMAGEVYSCRLDS